MIEHLTYLISSCKGYEAPLTRLLLSMRAAGIDMRSILVVAGGHPVEGRSFWHAIPIVEVTYTAYDYTALIEYVEKHWELTDHLFLLHDTMEIGAETDRLIREADPEKDATAVWGGECNLALYRADYLRSCRAQMRGLKNCSKLYAVEMEGFLWRQLPEERRGTYPGGIAIGDDQPTYAGAARQRVHYAGVDIVKWKANYGQAWPPAVVTP